MEVFYSVAYLLYVILGLFVISFVVWILPSLLLELWDFIPDGMIEKAQVYGLAIIGELNEHLHFIRQEQARHTKNFGGDMKFFTEMVIEKRDVNAGRRMPVRLRA